PTAPPELSTLSLHDALPISYVGLTPTTPHSDAGCRTDPPVSEPSATGAKSAATAAAEPPLDPPGTREGQRGLRVAPNAEFSVDEDRKSTRLNSSHLVISYAV